VRVREMRRGLCFPTGHEACPMGSRRGPRTFPAFFLCNEAYRHVSDEGPEQMHGMTFRHIAAYIYIVHLQNAAVLTPTMPWSLLTCDVGSSTSGQDWLMT
jgi:hypothetical protein